MDLEWIDNQPRQVEVGDRIKLVNMPDDPHPLETGTEGTVTSVDTRMEIIGVDWDNGSRLNLVLGVDSFSILNESSDKAIINKSVPKPTLKGKDISPTRTSMNKNFKSALKTGKVKDIIVDGVDTIVSSLEGGKADKMSVEDIAKKHDVSTQDIQKEIEVGVEIEMEHTNDPMKAKEVVMDHLHEFPDYYSNKEHGLKVSEKGLEKVHETTILEFFGAFGKKNKDDQYNLEALGKDLKKITNTLKTATFPTRETVRTMIEKFREKYSEHSQIDTMMKSLYHEFDKIVGGDIEEMTSAGSVGPAGDMAPKLESRIIKVRDLLEGTTTTNSGDYQNDSETPFDSNKDGWFWNDKPWWEGGKIVDDIAQLDHNWKDKLLSVKMTKEELIKTVKLLETKGEEGLDEVDATASGSFEGPMFAAKDDDSWNMGKKPIWTGGKIVQKVKNSGVLVSEGVETPEVKNLVLKLVKMVQPQINVGDITSEEDKLEVREYISKAINNVTPQLTDEEQQLLKDRRIEMGRRIQIYFGVRTSPGKRNRQKEESSLLGEVNKIKWVKGGSYVKLKDSCVKYNNQPWCSAGDADKPLILSKTTSDNISEVAKKLGISKEDVKKVVINRLTR